MKITFEVHEGMEVELEENESTYALGAFDGDQHFVLEGTALQLHCFLLEALDLLHEAIEQEEPSLAELLAAREELNRREAAIDAVVGIVREKDSDRRAGPIIEGQPPKAPSHKQLRDRNREPKKRPRHPRKPK